jgi:hypothetical protein
LIKIRSKSESFEILVEEIEAKNGRDHAFSELWRSRDFNYVGKIIVGGLGEEIPAKRLIGPDRFLRISGGVSVHVGYAERIKYTINLLNRILEKKSRLRWQGAGILTVGEKKGRLSILRDRKSEFEGMTRFVIIESVLRKWIA